MRSKRVKSANWNWVLPEGDAGDQPGIAARNGRNGGRLADRQGRIHGEVTA